MKVASARGTFIQVDLFGSIWGAVNNGSTTCWNSHIFFSDIEGSTKLWQQYPETMNEALSRHHALLNEAIAAHGGYVFQIIGDAFFAAFSTANEGLDAALEAQCALAAQKWGETGSIWTGR